ncbi:MAG: SRPBCC family protein [Pseudonocardiaceae bacterium]
MTTFERSVDVDVPVSTAYNQWTQFETFPEFMDGVDRIQQIDDTHTHWITSIGGVTREFDAEITEQRPDERVAWKTTSGPTQAGVVTFHRLNDTSTRVHLQLDFEPEGVVETIGSAVGAVGSRLQGDLNRFKHFIEADQQGRESGAWRGQVDADPQHTTR